MRISFHCETCKNRVFHTVMRKSSPTVAQLSVKKCMSLEHANGIKAAIFIFELSRHIGFGLAGKCFMIITTLAARKSRDFL